MAIAAGLAGAIALAAGAIALAAGIKANPGFQVATAPFYPLGLGSQIPQNAENPQNPDLC